MMSCMYALTASNANEKYEVFRVCVCALKERYYDMEVRISVRSLVEFILRSGDIDNRKAASAGDAMQEGGRIHRMIQRRMGPEYRAEVGLRYVHDAGEYEIIVEGRADGIITEVVREALPLPLIEEKTDDSETRLNVTPGQEQTIQKVTVTIDEIKGTYHD